MYIYVFTFVCILFIYLFVYLLKIVEVKPPNQTILSLCHLSDGKTLLLIIFIIEYYIKNVLTCFLIT